MRTAASASRSAATQRPTRERRSGKDKTAAHDRLRGSEALEIPVACGANAPARGLSAWVDSSLAARLAYHILLLPNPGFQPFGFAGGLYDSLTGLVRFGAREYDANTGRWATKDPGGFSGGPNLYAYAANDPINLVDWLGTYTGQARHTAPLIPPCAERPVRPLRPPRHGRCRRTGFPA